ncbi:hypothetical protein [Spirosoma fluminis]
MLDSEQLEPDEDEQFTVRPISTVIAVLVTITCILIVLNYVKIIDWSWLWLTVPLWGPVALFVAIGSGVALIYLIGRIINLFTAKNHDSRDTKPTGR